MLVTTLLALAAVASSAGNETQYFIFKNTINF